SPPALSFGPAADLYDEIRPTYPPAALEWALGAAPRRVVDLGAGTGILTRVALGLGYEVLPVEPDEGMRARLARSIPGTAPRAGGRGALPARAADDRRLVGQADGHPVLLPHRATGAAGRDRGGNPGAGGRPARDVSAALHHRGLPVGPALMRSGGAAPWPRRA